MNHPNPAIVAQGAVRRLPRWALVLFCVAYVLPGFIGRDPWKSADMTTLGYMTALAQGSASWFAPAMAGIAPEFDALLPYWLGAWTMLLAPSWVPADFAARVPFGLLLTASLIATWYGTYYLARNPKAQPVAFAFGGEALPPDYARAMADGALLAFIACLGLAQLAHETTPALAQLAFTALGFYAVAALGYRTWVPAIVGLAALVGLTLSGAPTLAALFGLGSALIHGLDRQTPDGETASHGHWFILAATALAALLATGMDLWQWRIAAQNFDAAEWRSLARLLLWFTWPAWPLALWTLWRWRHQLFSGKLSRHVGLPGWFVAVTLAATLTTSSADRSLLLSLPALAAMAAFALPTLERSVGALIDWFTLLFFSGCAIIVWVVWIAMQTGLPKQPAANVARLAPGFVSEFTLMPFLLALGATLVWAWLVTWRAGRHRTAIWKSLVLPAGGAALCWLLLMTLWLPLLNHARSYTAVMNKVMMALGGNPGCVEFHGLTRGQLAAFTFYQPQPLRPATRGQVSCRWLVVGKDAKHNLADTIDLQQWVWHGEITRPGDHEEDLLLYQRRISAAK